MPRRFRPSPALPAHLEALYARFPFDRSLADDPIGVIRPLVKTPRQAEIVGIHAATLAIGQTAAIRSAIARLVALAGGDLESFVLERASAERRRRLAPFRHRWIRGDQLAYLADRLAEVYRSGASLEQVFADGLSSGGFSGGLDALARRLRAPLAGRRLPRGYRVLFPSPLDATRSPAKRLTLFVRWMVRDRYPDLGVWRAVPTGELRIPLDHHVYWIAHNLGMTARRSRSWAAVEEVTDVLRRVDPIDPVRFDFVLCHTGVSGDCPKRRDPEICEPCAVRPDCRLWQGRAFGR